MQKSKKNIAKNVLDNSYKLSFKKIAHKINLYEKLHKYVLAELIHLEDHEPLKLFRHTHQEWELAKKNLTNLYDSITNEMGRESKSLEEIMNLVSRQI